MSRQTSMAFDISLAETISTHARAWIWLISVPTRRPTNQASRHGPRSTSSLFFRSDCLAAAFFCARIINLLGIQRCRLLHYLEVRTRLKRLFVDRTETSAYWVSGCRHQNKQRRSWWRWEGWQPCCVWLRRGMRTTRAL